MAQIADRQAQADQVLHTRILATGAQPDPRTETKTCKQQRRARIFPGKKIERGGDVLLLSMPLVVRALAQTHTSKIETQDRQAEAVERFSCLVNDFIMHRPTEKRMGMAHHGRKWRPRALA